MNVLVLVEHDQLQLKPSTFQTITAGLQISAEVDLCIIGQNCQELAKQAAKIQGIRSVLVADAKEYQHQMAENVAPLLAELASTYSHVLAPATTFGKNILPRAAAVLDCAMVSDVIKIEAPDTFVRPIYAGNALATVKSKDKIKLLTIRTTAFTPAIAGATEAGIKQLTQVISNSLSIFDSEEIHISERPDLTSARIIVAGGRGLKSAENFKKLEVLADTLGAAIGASRAAVDAGFAPNDYQVGQTGKVVAPDLYIAVGISGAIQHLAGMKDSKVIVAINNDPDAPIFEIADYGLVGDLFTILDELQTELKK